MYRTPNHRHCRHELVRAKNSTDSSVPTIFEPSIGNGIKEQSRVKM